MHSEDNHLAFLWFHKARYHLSAHCSGFYERLLNCWFTFLVSSRAKKNQTPNSRQSKSATSRSIWLNMVLFGVGRDQNKVKRRVRFTRWPQTHLQMNVAPCHITLLSKRRVYSLFLMPPSVQKNSDNQSFIQNVTELVICRFIVSARLCF